MKPDWAERLQRTFKRKFDAGVATERERIIKLLIAKNPQTLSHAIALIMGDTQ